MRRYINQSTIIKIIFGLSIAAIILAIYQHSKLNGATFMLPAYTQVITLIKVSVPYLILFLLYAYFISKACYNISRTLIQIDMQGINTKSIKRSILSPDGILMLIGIAIYFKFSALVGILTDFMASPKVLHLYYTSTSSRLALMSAVGAGYKLTNAIIFGLIITLIIVKRKAASLSGMPGSTLIKREIITPIDACIQTLPYAGIILVVYNIFLYWT